MMCLRAAGTRLFCSFCALSAQHQIAVLTVQQPFLHLQDKSGLLCQINHNCHFIHVHHSTKLKPFCPYAFQIVINSQLYIHCLLWQLQSGNEWSGSLILVWVLFLYCNCRSHVVCTPSQREFTVGMLLYHIFPFFARLSYTCRHCPLASVWNVYQGKYLCR